MASDKLLQSVFDHAQHQCSIRLIEDERRLDLEHIVIRPVAGKQHAGRARGFQDGA